MKIGFVAALSKDRISGPSNSVTNLAKYCCADVFTNINTEDSLELNGIKVKNKIILLKEMKKYDVIVITGIFDRNNIDIFKSCIRNRVNYIVSSRGNLTLESFNRSHFKKKIFMLLYGNKFINYAIGLHYLSKEEKNKSISIKNKKIIISSNGVVKKDIKQEYSKREKNIIFIGRIDIFHKGLDRLIKQVKINQSYLRLKNVKIKLFGPSNRNDKKKLMEYIIRSKIEDIMIIGPSVNKCERDHLLLTNKYFIHTSRLEGQPQAVLEAISAGCIPVVTDECNLSDSVTQYNLGFIVNCEKTRNIFTFLDYDEINYQKNCYEYSNKFLDWKLISKEFLNDIKL